MATSRTRRASMEQLQLEIDNQQGSQYACDCGQDFFDENYLKSHQQKNCANRQIKCSFCNEKFSSNELLKTHFMACGNKTEQCPNCRQFIRRSHFAYHYENQCAPIDKIETPPIPPRNPLNQRIQLNPNKPIARTDVPSDDSTISNVRYRLQTPNMYNPSAIYQCDFCHEKCTKEDSTMHRENCLKNPKNSNSSVRSPTVSTKSNGISHIPCEFCDQQIDLPNWSKHSQDCREKHKREYEERARSMSREPVNENLPCENCHKLFPAAQLYNHRCSPARVGTQYEVIDYDRTRQANQGVPRRTGTNERLIQPNNSLPRQNERRSPDNFERQRSRNDIPQHGRSTHKLRRGHNSFEIIDNREGQSIIKRKKPPLWKRLCCVAKGDTND